MGGWRNLGLLVALLVAAGPLSAQQPPPPGSQGVPVFRTSTDLVTIDAVVTGDDGKPVTDLTPEDFEVTVAGKRQTLEQAVYIRTRDQPRVLAAARAATASTDSSGAEDASATSRASQILKTAGSSPDQIARTIAIVVDDLGLSFESMYYVRRAIQQYIGTQVEPGDLVAIIRTAGGVGTLQQFTTDKRLLHRAADHLQWSMFARRSWLAFATTNGVETLRNPVNLPAEFGTGTVDKLHDSVSAVGSMQALEFVARGVSKLPGRKCIMYFSEGFPTIYQDRIEGGRLWTAMAHMLTWANAAGVVINTIDARGLVANGPGVSDVSTPASLINPTGWRASINGGTAGTTPGTSVPGSGAGFLDAPGAHGLASAGMTPNGSGSRGAALILSQESLAFIADQTGGLAVRDNNDLGRGIAKILEDQAGYYLLGYTASSGPHGGWDQGRVKVRVKRKGLHVRARQGFFGPLDTRERAAETPTDPLVLSALSPFGAGGVTVRLTAMFGHDATTGSYVQSMLFIDPSTLRFDVDDTGHHIARFQVLVMIVGDNGQIVDGRRRQGSLALTDENFQHAATQGLVVTVTSPVKTPGPYQVRAAVEDMASTSVGSASQFLEVPDVGKNQLALSGLVLKGATGDQARPTPDSSTPDASNGLADNVLFEPEVRVFAPGTKAVYAYEIYDGLQDKEAVLEMATAVIREGKVVYQSPFAPAAVPQSRSAAVAQSGGAAVRTIPIAGTLSLGDNMPAGPYTLEVIVRTPDGKKYVDWRQWADFEIRR